MTRKTKKTLIRAVAALLGFVLVVGAVSFIGKKTNGFADDITIDALTKRELNPDNLYTPDCLDEGFVGVVNTGLGFSADAKDDGSFVLDGKYEGEEEFLYPFASIELEAGTYTLTSGTETSMYSVYLTLTGGSSTKCFDFGGINGTVTIDTAATYELALNIVPGAEFDGKEFYPVIVKGDEAGEFYAD